MHLAGRQRRAHLRNPFLRHCGVAEPRVNQLLAAIANSFEPCAGHRLAIRELQTDELLAAFPNGFGP